MNISAQLATPAPSVHRSEIIDRAMILDRVGGDQELLREITGIFLEEYPMLIEEIKTAANLHDHKRLERAAHSLKGSVANFGASDATQAAFRLESLGRRNEMHDLGPALADLLHEFDQLRPALDELASWA